MDQRDKTIEDLQNEVKEYGIISRENGQNLEYSQSCVDTA